MKTDDYDDRALEQLIKSLGSTNAPVGRIGVLGGKTTRQTVGPTNAEIGAKHELGLDGMPVRSWLLVPLIDNLQKYLDQSKAFTPKALRTVIKQGSIKPWLEKAMTVAELVVAEGFASGGFGKWAAWKTKGYTNNTGDILVDTKQLRDSVTSEVK